MLSGRFYFSISSVGFWLNLNFKSWKSDSSVRGMQVILSKKGIPMKLFGREACARWAAPVDNPFSKESIK